MFQFGRTLCQKSLRQQPLLRGLQRQGQRHSTQKVQEAQVVVPENAPAAAEKIIHSVGVRLTKNEMDLLQKKLFPHGKCPQTQFDRMGQEALKTKTTREICLDAIANPENQLDKWGVRFISFFDYAGTALFAIVGTQVAGDRGYNIVGCCLTGCVAALGGGSVNAVLYGGANSFLGRPGVRWVANPSYLLVAILSSLVTFYAWPYYCKSQAKHYIENVIGTENLDPETGHIGRQAFMQAWHENKQFRQTIREALPHIRTSSHLLMEWRNTNQIAPNAKMAELIDQETLKDGNLYFDEIDDDGSDDIDMEELRRLVQRRFYNGWETFWMDTLGLSSLSIAAVIMAIRQGLHPVVAATSGVTVCFGGIFRDLLCGRDLAIGGQSYALCTGTSSTVYILLRELALRRIVSLPLVLRTFLSAGSCVALRGWEWFKGESLLAPMHGREA